MSSAIFIRLTGVKELDAALKAMPLELADKTMQSAGMGASRVLVQRARDLAPQGKEGNLKNAINTYKSSFKRVVSGAREIGTVSVGPRRGRFKGHHGHLIEFGTVDRYNTSYAKPAYRGSVTANPFMKPAFDQTKDQVVGSYNGFLGKRLVGVMKKKLGGVRAA